MDVVRRVGIALLGGIALTMASGSLAQPVVANGVLTSATGLTLYTFDNDVAGSGKSVCHAPCSGIFPPYLVEAGVQPAGEFSTIAREDGTRQWTYKGKPLYLWFDDKKPGDKGGDGMNRGIWHVARP